MPDFQFDSVSDFLAMGGYAFFVWVSYGLFALGMAWLLIQPRLQKRKVLEMIRARNRRDSASAGKPAEDGKTPD